MCSRLKGAASNLFNTIESSRGRRNANETHKCFALPWEVHRAAVEICFREGTLFKDMMAIVLGREVTRLEDKTVPADSGPSFSFDSKEGFVHTSVFLPNDLFHSLKKASHYTRIAEKNIILNGLAEYLFREYGEKYPDLVRPIENYKNEISKD